MALPQVQAQQTAPQQAETQSKDAVGVPKKVDDVKARKFKKKIKEALEKREQNPQSQIVGKKILLAKKMIREGDKKELKLVITEGKQKFPKLKINDRLKKKDINIEENKKKDFDILNQEDFKTDESLVIENIIRQNETTVDIELKTPELLEQAAGESGMLQEGEQKNGDSKDSSGLKVDMVNTGKKDKTGKEVKNSRRGEKPDVMVVDRRRRGRRNVENQPVRGQAAEQVENQGDYNDSFSVDPAAGDGVIEGGDAFSGEDNLNVVLKGDGSAITAEGDGGKAQAPVVREAQAQLAKQLKEGVNREVVKQTGIILKDNNEGEIRLILKPEALGKVKIRLHLQDNNIVGRIIVENNSVKEVFEQNLDNLTRSLAESGFETAGLEVSVSGEERGREQAQDDQQESGNRKRHLAVLADSVPTVRSSLYGDSRINLVI